MASAAKQAPTASAPTQADLDRIRFVKATGKCSTLHLADGKTGICDHLWEMRPATEEELTKLAGKLCKVCVLRVTPKPEKPEKATKAVESTVKVTKTKASSPRTAKTVQDLGAEGQQTQAKLKIDRQQRELVAAARP
jgi:hypothetical protein